MEQEREDYRDCPDPPPSQWADKKVLRLWLLLIALVVAAFAAVIWRDSRPTP
jgi:hypothetical protein